MDGDDICLPNRFERLISNINKNISIIGSYTKEIDEKNNSRIKKVPLNHSSIKKFIKFRNPFNHNSVAYRVDHVLKVGGYPNLYLKEDYGLWIKLIANNYQGLNIPEILVEASFDSNSYSRRSGYDYLKSDILLSKMQYNLNMINFFELIYISFIRLLFILTPNRMKKILYRLLRVF